MEQKERKIKMEQTKLNEILRKHKLWLEDDEKGERANLQDANLQNADLEGVNLQDANLQNANLKGSNLQDADLQNADLKGSNLQNAYLQDAYLQDVYLQGADLQNADLKGSDLQDADLQRANLQGADLDFSCLPLWCGGLNFKIDERIAKQITYHLINLMQYSDLKASKIFKKEVYKWLEDSHLVKEKELPKIEEKED